MADQPKIETPEQLRIRQLESENASLHRTNLGFSTTWDKHCRTIRQMQVAIERHKRTIKILKAEIKRLNDWNNQTPPPEAGPEGVVTCGVAHE